MPRPCPKPFVRSFPLSRAVRGWGWPPRARSWRPTAEPSRFRANRSAAPKSASTFPCLRLPENRPVPSPEPLANLDGRLLPLAEARVSALDRGFLFGDGVYEVLRVYFGQPWLEDAHFWRLERSLREIRIGGIDLDRLRRRMR